jgi:hypothetical protein
MSNDGPQPAVPSSMRVGLNYPFSFNRFGGDIGPNPHVSLTQWNQERQLEQQGKERTIPLPPLFDNIDRNLENLERMGIDIVRYFMVANGFVYGNGPTNRNTPSPNPALPFFDWDFTVPPRTDRRFLFHFEELLKRFVKAGVQIIPSIVSFEFGGNSRSRDAKGLAPGGRSDVFKDAVKRSLFINTLLADLLTVARPFLSKKIIYAFEVMNEPFWNVSPFGPLSTAVPVPPPTPGAPFTLQGFMRVPEVDDAAMNQFFREAIQLIGALGFESTVGHRFFQDILDKVGASRFDTGSLPQFHYYAKPAFGFGDPQQIKGEKLFRPVFFNGRKKPFLGEFDSDFNTFGKAWTELGGNDTTFARLQLLEAEGCEVALLWPDKGPDENARKAQNLPLDVPDPIKLRQKTREQVVQFTRGSLPTNDATDNNFI